MIATLPAPARVVERRQDAHNIFTLTLHLEDEALARRFAFQPGQFNMLYVFGSGEIPISISSDPDRPESLDHTIRIVGDVSRRLARLEEGAVVGLRGPFGNPWPIEAARGRDIIVLTGGLGCAPAVSVIDYVMHRRADYGRVDIFHGAKLPRDVIYRERFAAWDRQPDTRVHLTVDDAPEGRWPHQVGVVTALLERAALRPDASIAMMCGPEVMMRHAGRKLVAMGLRADDVYLSMERNLKCAVGFCGHCQYGPEFVCRDGAVFPYPRIARLLEIPEV